VRAVLADETGADMLEATHRSPERGGAMPERQLPRAANDDMVQVDTPVIDIQDVEHQASEETRVNSKGVEVRPSDEPLQSKLPPR
jgi:hypothetical protein